MPHPTTQSWVWHSLFPLHISYSFHIPFPSMYLHAVSKERKGDKIHLFNSALPTCKTQVSKLHSSFQQHAINGNDTFIYPPPRPCVDLKHQHGEGCRAKRKPTHQSRRAAARHEYESRQFSGRRVYGWMYQTISLRTRPLLIVYEVLRMFRISIFNKFIIV